MLDRNFNMKGWPGVSLFSNFCLKFPARQSDGHTFKIEYSLQFRYKIWKFVHGFPDPGCLRIEPVDGLDNVLGLCGL